MAFDINDLKNIDFTDMGSLPWIVKGIIIGVVCLVILGVGFWFLNKPQLAQLKKEQTTEQTLRRELESKQSKAASLAAYKKQMEEIKYKFGELLRILPNKTEISSLLEDISVAGVTTGLRFTTFKPKSEIQAGFYAELPIEIQVIGTYHQIAQFLAKLAALDRIVIVTDFKLVPFTATANKAIKKKSATEKEVPVVDPNVDTLVGSFIARTYRYQENNASSDEEEEEEE